ncbi:redox-regulated ATPase YchF [Patescibacteria group bacterium]|nr:redox-regulated ATPase YchF [Patescibacteria group bacterium]
MSSLKVGIVGLPNVGKSTLFNALLKKRVAFSANFPFATVEPNIGVVAVPDVRLSLLADLVVREEKMENLPPIVSAVVQFVDIAGLVKGASKGAGLGNQFLSHIREVDAIIEVVRDFEDENIIREGSENPDSDILTVETELALADLQVIEKLVVVQEKQAKISKDALDQIKLDILNKAKRELEKGEIGSFDFAHVLTDERLKDWFVHLPLLFIKPILYVYNVSEENYGLQLHGGDINGNKLVISAKLEEELADLSDEDRLEYLKEVGIEKTGLERLIVKAYDLLNLISFLTAGKKEVRAWTVKSGTKAPQAAGVIHSDFEKNFIRAQVIECGKLIEAGSYVLAKQNGWVRTEGRDYAVKDGDVIEFFVSS